MAQAGNFVCSFRFVEPKCARTVTQGMHATIMLICMDSKPHRGATELLSFGDMSICKPKAVPRASIFSTAHSVSRLPKASTDRSASSCIHFTNVSSWFGITICYSTPAREHHSVWVPALYTPSSNKTSHHSLLSSIRKFVLAANSTCVFKHTYASYRM
jgi:hypothetical protein